ncbi:MAG: AraC family transcriptional regulator, partial [Mucilaginibacter sp.]
MKTVTILVPESAVLQGVADPRYLFTAVNEFLKSAGKPPLFNVQLVGLSKEVMFNGGTFSIHTDLLLDEAKKSDLVIVPPLSGDLPAAIKLNEA